MRTFPLLLLLGLVAGCTGESGVVVYNAPPTAAILSPPDGTTVDENIPLTFEGRVSDDGGPEALTVQWTSDKDGILSETSIPDPDGRVEYVTANLSPGNHAIGLRVIDEEGEQGATTVTVTIIDLPEPPEIDLVRPTQGERYEEGSEAFEYTAVVSDAQDEATSLEVVFLSNHDGFLCSTFADATGEARCTASPQPNREPHLITVEVEDSDGNMDNATAYMTVVAIEDQDDDGDGFTPNQGDCDDNNDTTYPGAEEHPNDVDDDCDGIIDEGTINYDDDGDGYSEVDGDCDDTNRLTFPEASEVEDGEDNDCDGTIDEGTRVYDDDGDGYSEVDGDCNDGDDTVNPGATESCNGKDDDCDTLSDEENASGCSTFWADDDRDSYGDGADSKCLCSAYSPYTATNGRDCYDGNASARPGQTSWFGSDRGDGSYDYDCVGGEQKQYTARFSCSGAVWVCTSHRDGWTGSTPACGVTATWATDCDGTFTSCNADGKRSLQQTCR